MPAAGSVDYQSSNHTIAHSSEDTVVMAISIAMVSPTVRASFDNCAAGSFWGEFPVQAGVQPQVGSSSVEKTLHAV